MLTRSDRPKSGCRRQASQTTRSTRYRARAQAADFNDLIIRASRRWFATLGRPSAADTNRWRSSDAERPLRFVTAAYACLCGNRRSARLVWHRQDVHAGMDLDDMSRSEERRVG